MRHNAKVEEKRRLEKLKHEHTSFYGVYHNDKRNGILTKGYPYSTNHKNMKKWFRRLSNRKFRRKEDDILNGGQHKKHFDLWWTLF
jgi:hypothetical protein